MSRLGLIIAISPEVEDKLLMATGDLQVLEIVREIESLWDETWLCELGKSWEGIHKALSSSEHGPESLKSPLNRAVLGGRQCYYGDDYIVSYVTRSQVKEIATALAGFYAEAFKKGYGLIGQDSDNYPFYGDEDLEYCLEYFLRMRSFYLNAAEYDRATIFTTDQ